MQISLYTSSVFVAQVRKSPDVAQADTVTDAGKDEVHFPRPLLTLRNHSLLVWHQR